MPLNIRGRKIRSLSDIRTMEGRVDSASDTYKVYLRIAALEMEKTRRGMERDDALRRVERLEQRTRDIEAEKRFLFESMSARDAALAELRPAYAQRIEAMHQAARSAADEARHMAEELRQRELAEAQEALQHKDEATEQRRRRQSGPGFKLRY